MASDTHEIALLRLLRNAEGLSQLTLAGQTGIHPGRLANAEALSATLSEEQLGRIADALRLGLYGGRDLLMPAPSAAALLGALRAWRLRIVR